MSYGITIIFVMSMVLLGLYCAVDFGLGGSANVSQNISAISSPAVAFVGFYIIAALSADNNAQNDPAQAFCNVLPFGDTISLRAQDVINNSADILFFIIQAE